MIKKYTLLFLFLLSTFSAFKMHGLTLTRVILATDANENYIQFWPVVAKAWQEIVGIRPTLALIASNDINVDESLGDVIRFAPIKNVPTALYAQCIRLLLPAIFPDDVCIISDMDMIPLQKNYFTDPIKDIPHDHIAVYRSKTLLRYKQYPMCYVAAKGCLFADIFNINDKNQIPEIIQQWSKTFSSAWDTDQKLLYEHITRWNKFATHCTLLDVPVKRIDRAHWGYNQQLLNANMYTDCHCPRPYNKYKISIDTILEQAIAFEKKGNQ